MPPISSCRRRAVAAAAVLAALASTTGSAAAAVTQPGCPVAPTFKVFAPWGDLAEYQLAPGGDVEDGGASWTLAGGATVQEGNEAYMVTSPADRLSLRLEGSSSATTRRMCVGVEHPSFRFFVRRSGGSATSRLAVDVVVDDARGRERSLTVGLVGASASWAPSAPLPIVVNLLAVLRDNAIDVSFRFRPVGDGAWSIDDVYVDPYRTY